MDLGRGSPCTLLVDTPPNGPLFRKGRPARVDLAPNGWFVFFGARLLLNKRAGMANLVIDQLANLTTKSVREAGFPSSAF